jgi:hypothetical protein
VCINVFKNANGIVANPVGLAGASVAQLTENISKVVNNSNFNFWYAFGTSAVITVLSLALLAYVLYLTLTVYVNINAHLKNEFRLTYGKLGPTELRLAIVVICLLYMYVPFFLTFQGHAQVWVWSFSYGLFDILGTGICLTMMVMYLVYFVKDAKWFAERDPLIKHSDE